MTLLIDTHVLLWALHEPARLSDRARGLLEDGSVQVLVSTVSAWEIAIKESLRKLLLPAPSRTWLAGAVANAGFDWLDIRLEDTLRVGDLPHHHHDPFDRLLVAQAMGRGLRLVSADHRMPLYNDQLTSAVIW
jgi:PIN domain nuclease of toxin-antitoxin system